MVLLLQNITFIVTSIYIKLFIKLEVVGIEKIKDLKPPLIMVANHKSYADHFLLGYALMGKTNSPFMPLRFFTADRFFKVWWTGWGLLLKGVGAFRAHKGEGLNISLKEPIEILKSGGTLAFYPEGKLYKEKGLIGDPRRGIGALGFWSGEKILPVAIKGSENWKTGVKIIFGDTFYIKDIVKEPELRGDDTDYMEAAQAVMNKVRDLFNSN